MKKITELTAELAAPAIAEQGCTLWDVEYVKEAGTWYLRILLDKEGGVDVLDCEAISRKRSDLLDEDRPHRGQLHPGGRLRPGAERALKQPARLPAVSGRPRAGEACCRARDGRGGVAGCLAAYDAEATGDVTVTVGSQDLVFPKKETALIRLRVEF
ncbi:MAG: ribosome maturation factor RimP [Dysosmobacter sp.]